MKVRIKTLMAAAALALGVAACHGLGMGGSGVELVKDGKAVSEIVVAKDALQGVKLAAGDLQKHLELISGAKLPIVAAPTPGVENQVYVGESEFTKKLGFVPAKFNNSGFEIVAEGHHVILAGPDKQRQVSRFQQEWYDSAYLGGSVITGKVFPKPKNFPSPGLKAWQDFCGEKFSTDNLNNGPGTFNAPLGIYTNDDLCTWSAVAELLEQLGVRWYMPYENGTVVPEMKTVAIPAQNLKKEAKFGKREWEYYGPMRSDAEGIAWLKRLKAGDRNMIIFNHTTYAIYSSYEQQQLHPEYLVCDSDGKPDAGFPTGRGMPRYTNPGFRKAAANYMDKVFDTYPDLAAMTIGPPDGGVRMDARDLGLYGKPTDTVNQKASNYVWDFHVFLAKELKKSHPDKCLLYMTGVTSAGELPSNITEFPDNLVIPFVGTSAYRVLQSENNRILAASHKWLDKIKASGVSPLEKSPVWDYYLYYYNPSSPRYPVVFTESLQAQMQEMLPYADGKFIEIQPGAFVGQDGKKTWRLGVPGLMHLMVYWQNKLFWDPGLDRKKTLDEYYRLFFGPAEAEMREFYEFAESAWNRQESRSLTETTGFLKEKDVDRFFALLSQARAKAGEGTVYDKRVALIEGEMQSLKKLFPNLKRGGPEIRAYPAPESFKLDGDLGEHKYGWTPLRDMVTGEVPDKNASGAFVSLTPDKSVLVVGVVCHESRMDKLKAGCKINDDGGIFNDDVVEIYVNTPERSYFKIAVNPNGAVWDESTDVAIIDRDTLSILWNPGVKAAVKKYPDRWTVEVMIPTKDFGGLGPSKEYPWGIQVGRTRFSGGSPEAWAIAPVNGPYATLNRWGNLWMR